MVCTMCDELHTHVFIKSYRYIFTIKAVHVWCDPPSSFSQGVDFKQCDLSPSHPPSSFPSTSPPPHVLSSPFLIKLEIDFAS